MTLLNFGYVGRKGQTLTPTEEKRRLSRFVHCLYTASGGKGGMTLWAVGQEEWCQEPGAEDYRGEFGSARAMRDCQGMPVRCPVWAWVGALALNS